jgi:Xaa-Pro aminopeptidase
MKYSKINNSLFVKNRRNFLKKMIPKSIVFFNSNDLYPVSADTTLPFEQHRDVFYLSGIDQEESVLLLLKNKRDSNIQEILFFKKT